MAKTLSTLAVVWLGGYDLTPDTTSVEMESLVADVESTTLPQSAERVIAGLKGGSFVHEGILDDNAAVTITSSSVANPSNLLCATPHGLLSGNTSTIAAHSGSSPSINGVHTVTVVDTLNFTIPVNVTSGGTGGTSTRGGGLHTAAAALIATIPAVTMAVQNSPGKRAMSALFLETAFKTPVALGGLIMVKVEGKTDQKVEVGVVLQPKVSVIATTNGASLNNAASSANGAVGFLHVFASNGTADVIIEESSNDGGGDPFATKLTFPQFSGIGSVRVAVTGTVEQYLRAVITFGSATRVTFAVTLARL